MTCLVEPLQDGTRVGRFVVLRDVEGRTCAVSAGAVGALCETDQGTLMMLLGGRLLEVPWGMGLVLGWLDGRG